jgi:hypothetical protein
MAEAQFQGSKLMKFARLTDRLRGWPPTLVVGPEFIEFSNISVFGGSH